MKIGLDVEMAAKLIQRLSLLREQVRKYIRIKVKYLMVHRAFCLQMKASIDLQEISRLLYTEDLSLQEYT